MYEYSICDVCMHMLFVCMWTKMSENLLSSAFLDFFSLLLKESVSNKFRDHSSAKLDSPLPQEWQVTVSPLLELVGGLEVCSAFSLGSEENFCVTSASSTGPSCLDLDFEFLI